MPTSRKIPKGAKSVEYIVDPDPEGIFKLGGWEAWQQHIKQEMEEEGITVISIESNIFSGYYFPD